MRELEKGDRKTHWTAVIYFPLMQEKAARTRVHLVLIKEKWNFCVSQRSNIKSVVDDGDCPNTASNVHPHKITFQTPISWVIFKDIDFMVSSSKGSENIRNTTMEHLKVSKSPPVLLISSAWFLSRERNVLWNTCLYSAEYSEVLPVFPCLFSDFWRVTKLLKEKSKSDGSRWFNSQEKHPNFWA